MKDIISMLGNFYTTVTFLLCSFFFPFNKQQNPVKHTVVKRDRIHAVESAGSHHGWRPRLEHSDMNGIFVNTSSIDTDTLVFGSGSSWFRLGNQYKEQYFFLMTRDSLNRQIIIHGAWDFDIYNATHDSAVITFYADGLGEWESQVSVKDDGGVPFDPQLGPTADIKIVSIDTIVDEDDRVLRNFKRKPYTFQKKFVALTVLGR